MILIHNEIVLLFQRHHLYQMTLSTHEDKSGQHIYWKDGVDTIGIRTPFKNFVVQNYHVKTFSLVLLY